MALGHFFREGFQWGPDVIFTYGPLGFVMGNTYWGKLFWEMIAWQAVQAVVFGALLVGESRRMRGLPKIFFVLFVLLFALIYEDALHMIAIALLGLRMVRRAGDEPKRRWIRPAVLLPAAFFAIAGIEQALPGVVRGAANQFEDRAWTRTVNTLQWSNFRQYLRDQMHDLRKTHELPEIRKVVGDSTVDIFGFEQGIALLNKFN